MSPFRFALFATLAAQTFAPAAAQETWPQWRGPDRDGRAEGPAWPEDLSPERLAQAWSVDGLGPSYSGPIVGPERVYTTETVDERDEVVRAFDRETGQELWSARWAGSMEVPFFAARNGSWIRSTPAFDGQALFVAGMRDVLVCLEAASGDVRWRVDFPERFGTEVPAFGFVCSPLVEGEHVYVQGGSSVVKIDKHTGDIAWRTMVEGEGVNGGAFSSPVLTDLHGKRQLIVQSRSTLAGVALEDGGSMWSIPIEAFRGMNILTPLVFGDSVFTSTFGGRSLLVGIERQEDSFRASRAWKNGTQGYMTSPVLIDGHAYLFTRGNRFACVDLVSGEDCWTSPPTGDSYWSLAFRGDRILALSDSGTLRLLHADPEEYRVLAERDLVEGEAWAHLAPAGRQLFVRELRSLQAFEWR